MLMLLLRLVCHGKTGLSLVLGLLLTLWTTSTGWSFSTIIVDAGHGGADRGGIPGQKIAEDEMTLKVALKLEPLLIQKGYKVIMTRRTDIFLTLAERCRIANRERNALFVSVHFDAYSRSGAHGITTYYTRNDSRELARHLHRRMAQKLNPQQDRGVARARFYVIRNTLCPAVLLEGGFLTNPWESKRIATPEYQQAMAEAVAQGIVDYDPAH